MAAGVCEHVAVVLVVGLDRMVVGSVVTAVHAGSIELRL